MPHFLYTFIHWWTQGVALCPETELLDHMLIIFSLLKWNFHTIFLDVCTNLKSHHQNAEERSLLPHSHHDHDETCSDKCEATLRHSLICISIMVSNVEFFFFRLSLGHLCLLLRRTYSYSLLVFKLSSFLVVRFDSVCALALTSCQV